MCFVYVLLLKTGEFYKGLTDNLERRLKQHVDGKVFATKNKLPFTLVHVEVTETRLDARNLEKYFKSGFGREIIKEIIEER